MSTDALPYYIAAPSAPSPLALNAPAMNAPVIPADVRAQVAQQSVMPAIPAPQLGPVGMNGGPPAIPAPSLMPNVTMNPKVASSPNSGDSQIYRDQDRLNALRSTGAGVDQIHNPLLHGLAKAGDIASQIAGSVFLPARAIATAIPGTSFHHQYLVNQAQQNLANDQATQQQQLAQQDTQAQIAKRQADTDNALHPNLTPLQTDTGYAAYDPKTGTAKPVVDPSGQSLTPYTKPEPHYVSTADGNVVAVTTGPGGIPKATTVYEGSPKQQTDVTQLEVNGKQHTVIVDKNTGATVKDLGETGEKPPTVSMSTGTFSLASMPDGKGGTKSVLLNNKTGEVKDAPTGLSKAPAVAAGAEPPMTTADKNRRSLAIIASNNLDQIQDIVSRRGKDLLGPGAGRLTSVDQMMGSDDPDLVALGNAVHNFAMANAGIHGSRSFENVRAAETELLNNFKSGPEGVQGGINENRQNLTSIINPHASGPSTDTKSYGGHTYARGADGQYHLQQKAPR